MEGSRFLPIARTSHGIAWVVWALFFINCVRYLISPFIEPRINAENYDWINLLMVSLFIAAMLEAGLTILIRYLAILRPYKRKTYNPHERFARFFIVCFINWFLGNSITLYGPIFYYMSGFLWAHFIFGTMGAFLLIYHSPRLKPFTKMKKGLVQNEILETEYSQIK